MARNPLNDLFQPQPQQAHQGGKNPLQLFQDFQRFASGISPEKAQQKVQELLSTGKMSQQQFQQLQQQAKSLMALFGIK